MAKLLSIGSGGAPEEIQPVNTSAGAGDAAKAVELDAAGKLSSTMMPTGFGADSQSIITSENLASGDLVNVYDNAAVATARKADGTAVGKECIGFVLAATTSPDPATVYFEGTIAGLSGLTIGAAQFMSDTAGAIVETPLSGSGNALQQIGRAISATAISFEPQTAMTRV